jgi:hypothetical protein
MRTPAASKEGFRMLPLVVAGMLPRKLRAVRCYRSQLALFRYERAVQGLNRYRGVLGAGSRYAEAFMWLDSRLPGPLPVPPG